MCSPAAGWRAEEGEREGGRTAWATGGGASGRRPVADDARQRSRRGARRLVGRGRAVHDEARLVASRAGVRDDALPLRALVRTPSRLGRFRGWATETRPETPPSTDDGCRRRPRRNPRRISLCERAREAPPPWQRAPVPLPWTTFVLFRVQEQRGLARATRHASARENTTAGDGVCPEAPGTRPCICLCARGRGGHGTRRTALPSTPRGSRLPSLDGPMPVMKRMDER